MPIIVKKKRPGFTEDVSTSSYLQKVEASMSSGTSTKSASSKKEKASGRKSGASRSKGRASGLDKRDKRRAGRVVRKVPGPARIFDREGGGLDLEAGNRLEKSPRGKKDSLTFVSAWHPAMLFKNMAKGARSFLIHVKKAVDIALGKKEDKLPAILVDPPAARARMIFKSWKDGWAVDVETPSLTEFKLLSVAVCGSPNLAMVWSNPKKMGVLREALKSKARKIVQNGDFDIGVFQTCGFECDPETFWDTMIEGAILHPDEPVNLSFLASNAVDTHAWKFQREGDLYIYNAIDAWTTWMIYLNNQRGYDDNV